MSLSWPIVERIPLWGEAALSPHGLGIAVGFVVAAGIFARVARERGLGGDGDTDVQAVAQDLVVRAVLGAIVVGRLAYVATHLDRFTGDTGAVWSILRVTDGGFSFLGGVTGALLLCVPWIRRQGFATSRVLDAGAPAVAVGLVCGRIGDLMIGDHIGAPSGAFPLGWSCARNLYDDSANAFGSIAPQPYPFDASAAPVQGCFDVAVHQTALYDAVAALVVLAVTLWLVRRDVRRGVVAASWVLTYAPLRVLGDVLREDRRFLGLTGSQWTLVLAFAAVSVWLARSRARVVDAVDRANASA